MILKNVFNKFLVLFLYLLPGIIFVLFLSTFIRFPAIPILAITILIAILISCHEIFTPYHDLFVLGFYLVAFNLVYFYNVVLDIPRDTTVYYEYFYIFYNYLYKTGEVPLWFPDIVYGVRSAFFQLGFLAPTSYLLMFLGTLFHVQNVYSLFIGSAFLQQSIYLLGIYMLAGALKFSRISRFILSFTAIASLLWYQHYFFELQLIYFFPCQLYLIYQACITLKAKYIILLAIVFTFWLLGGLYLPILGFYICIVFGATLLIALKKWPKFTFEKKDFGLAAVFLFIFTIFLCLFYLSNKDSTFPGRSSETLQNSNTKLIYNRTHKESIDHLIINALDPINAKFVNDYTLEQSLHIYIGILPLFFLFYVLLKKEKSPVFYAALIAGFFVLYLSFNETFARVIINFPFLSYYSWLDLSYAYVRVLFTIAAIYGFEKGIQEKKDLKNVAIIIVTMAFFLDSGLAAILSGHAKDYSHSMSTFSIRIMIYLIAILLPILLKKLKGNKFNKAQVWMLFQYTLSFALILDLLSYQLVWATILPKQQKTSIKQALTIVSEITYHPERTLNAQTIRGKAINEGQFFRRFHYPAVYQFGDFDPCLPAGYIQVIEKNTQPIQSFLLKYIKGQKSPISESIQNLIACQTDKMRLVPKALYTPSDITVKELIHRDLKTNIVVTGVKTQNHSQNIDTKNLPQITLDAYSYNRLTIQVENPYTPGAWFYYSDSYHPDWQAFLDGQNVKISRANINFKAVWIPFGSHTLKFEFIDPILSSLQLSIFIIGSVGTVLIICFLLIFSVRETKYNASETL